MAGWPFHDEIYLKTRLPDHARQRAPIEVKSKLQIKGLLFPRDVALALRSFPKIFRTNQ